MLCCNPCYNGNDLQVFLTKGMRMVSCNPCYNGNDLQDLVNWKGVHYVVILVIMEMTYKNIETLFEKPIEL